MYDGPAVHDARCEDGVHIAYQVFGDGPIDLVLVHGATCSTATTTDRTLDGGELGAAG